VRRHFLRKVAKTCLTTRLVVKQVYYKIVYKAPGGAKWAKVKADIYLILIHLLETCGKEEFPQGHITDPFVVFPEKRIQGNNVFWMLILYGKQASKFPFDSVFRFQRIGNLDYNPNHPEK
jgi:hypothetical protein